VQLSGGSGILNSTGVNRYMRDARAQCVAEGSTDNHYAIISNQLLHGQPTLMPRDIRAESLSLAFYFRSSTTTGILRSVRD
jgi:hypothetical protein